MAGSRFKFVGRARPQSVRWGSKYGDEPSHGRLAMLCWFLYSSVVSARCSLAFSSCSTMCWSLGELRKGLTTGSDILFCHFWEFKVPCNTSKLRMRSEENAVHTTSPSHSSLHTGPNEANMDTAIFMIHTDTALV